MSLHLSIKSARVHQTRLLLEIGTDPNTADRDTHTPLMLACLIDKQHVGVRIVRMLLQKRAVVSTKDKHRRTALSYACMTGKEKIVNLLLEDIEYDINSQDDEGNTPLLYTAMSGNPTAMRYLLNVLMKYRLSVDLRNKKGFSAYLLAAKMGHFYCAHILKTEGYASDGIRDTEHFLCDKEWMKKVRKEIAKMHPEEKDSRLVHSRLTPGQNSKISRPYTSVDLQRTQSNFSRRPVESSSSRRVRAGTRLTTRSEPARLLKYNSWISIPDAERAAAGRMSRCSSTSDNNFMVSSANSTESTLSVPSEARTKTPNLHAILSQYLHQAVHMPVKIAPRNNGRNVKFVEGDRHEVTKASPPRQRKHNRMLSRQNTRKNLVI